MYYYYGDSNEFLIQFGGDSHILVETLTEFLNKYSKLLYDINTQLGYSYNDLIIEVSPPENGSFKIRLSPKYENHLLGTISGIVAGTLSGLILAWILSSDKVLSVEDVQRLIESMETQQEIEIVNNVYNLYQRVDIRQTLNQTFQIVDKDKNIESLDISHNDREIINIPKSEFKKYIKPQSELIEEATETERVEVEQVDLIVKTVHFEGEAKWGFIWRGYPIRATIKDERFIDKLNTEAFKRGDILKVRLQKRSVFNDDLNTYIVDEKSYVIIEVIKHVSRPNNDNYVLGLTED
jgi:hypothetical protein